MKSASERARRRVLAMSEDELRDEIRRLAGVETKTLDAGRGIGPDGGGDAPADRLAVSASGARGTTPAAGPRLDGSTGGRPSALVAVFGSPWARPVEVRAGASVESLSQRSVMIEPAGVGRLEQALPEGPLGRWDEAAVLDVRFPNEMLASVGRLAALGGEARLLVSGAAGWELLAYRAAELIGPGRYRLFGLLRGLLGTPIATAPEGALCLMADHRLQSVELTPDEIDVPMIWQAVGRGGFGAQVDVTLSDLGGRAYAPGHLRLRNGADGRVLSWVRRGADIGNAWRDEAFVNRGTFEVTWLSAGQVLETEIVGEAHWPVPADVQAGDAFEVREIMIDGRRGRSASIRA